MKCTKRLKGIITSDPALKYLDITKPFILNTDASNEGIGCILSQLDDEGNEHPFALASRILNAAENKYSTTEKKFLAIMWGSKILRPFYGVENIQFTQITNDWKR